MEPQSPLVELVEELVVRPEKLVVEQVESDTSHSTNKKMKTFLHIRVDQTEVDKSNKIKLWDLTIKTKSS